jgi:hypothetical protein
MTKGPSTGNPGRHGPERAEGTGRGHHLGRAAAALTASISSL